MLDHLLTCGKRDRSVITEKLITEKLMGYAISVLKNMSLVMLVSVLNDQRHN
jgi:hypothetical protein